MREEGIKLFLYSLGVQDSQIKVERNFVNTYCIFAPWLHESGKDTRPSFGISINDEGESFYYCFGCTPEGRNLTWVLHLIWLFTGEYPFETAKIYLNHEIFSNEEDDQDFPEFYDIWEENNISVIEEKNNLYEIPASILKKFPLLQGSNNRFAHMCKNYFKARKIDEWAVHFAGVRYNPNNFSVVYPMTLPNSKIYLLRERLIFAKKIWTVSQERAKSKIPFSKLKYSGALFGAHLVDWEKPVTIVEGGEDLLRLYTLGYFNAVGVLTTSFTKAQLEVLKRAPMLIVGFDADKAGERATYRLCNLVKGEIPVARVNWNDAGIGIKGELCKDSGDLLSRSQIADVFSNMIIL